MPLTLNYLDELTYAPATFLGGITINSNYRYVANDINPVHWVTDGSTVKGIGSLANSSAGMLIRTTNTIITGKVTVRGRGLLLDGNEQFAAWLRSADNNSFISVGYRGTDTSNNLYLIYGGTYSPVPTTISLGNSNIVGVYTDLEIELTGTQLIATVRNLAGAVIFQHSLAFTNTIPLQAGFGVGADNPGGYQIEFLKLESGDSVEQKSIAYTSSDDTGQGWNDFSQTITLGLEERLEETPYTLRDFLAQPVAVGRPIYPPSLSDSRATYQLESIMGKMGRTVANKGFNQTLTAPNNTAKDAVLAVLNNLKLEFPWLDWEPLPDLDLEVSAGAGTQLLVPRIEIARYIAAPESRNRQTILEIVLEYLNPFVLAGYEYAPSPNNKFQIKPPARKQSTGAAIAINNSHILAEGAIEITPRYEVATVAEVEYKPWSFQDGVPVAENSTIRIMPLYFNPENNTEFFQAQQAPWLASGVPAKGAFAPDYADSVGNPVTFKEIGFGGALLFYAGGGPTGIRDSYLFDVNKTFTLPLVENTVIKSGTNISFDLTLKRWSSLRTPNPSPAQSSDPISDLTATVTLSTDGNEHLLHNFGGYWFTGLLDQDKPVTYLVYGKYVGTKVEIRVVANPHQRPSFLRPGGGGNPGNTGWDFGTVLQIEATATAYAQNDVEIKAAFGDDPTRAEDFTKIPWLAAAQTNNKNVVSLTIDLYNLAIDGMADVEVLRALLESILRERSRPRRLWEVPLGAIAPVTPFDVNKLVSVPFTDSGFGLLVSVSSDGSSQSRRLSSRVVTRIEALAEEFSPLFFNGSIMLRNGSDALGV
jgi:hypothetical protein